MLQQQQQMRQNSTLKGLYKYVFRSNITYITFIVAGCVALDAVYGKTFDYVWDTYNKGKQYKVRVSLVSVI